MDEINKPSTIYEENLSVSSLVSAGKGRRFADLIIDYVGAFIFAFVLGLFAGFIGLSHLLNTIDNTLLSIIIVFLYYLICESLWQRTLGKLITRTKVVMDDGSIPDFPHILGRTLSRLIPFEPLSFLGTTGWHDKLSHTKVVLVKASPENIPLITGTKSQSQLSDKKNYCNNCGDRIDEGSKFCGSCGHPTT